jgi:hypothetical protein
MYTGTSFRWYIARIFMINFIKRHRIEGTRVNHYARVDILDINNYAKQLLELLEANNFSNKI